MGGFTRTIMIRFLMPAASVNSFPFMHTLLMACAM